MWFHTLVFNFQASERKRSTNDQYILLVYIPILPAFVITSSKESIAFEDDCPIRRDINLDSSPTAIQIDVCFSRCDMSMAQVNRCSSTRGTDDCSFKKFIKHNMTCSSKSVIRTQKAIFRFTADCWQSSCPHDHNVHVSSILYGHETYAVYHSMVLCVRI